MTTPDFIPVLEAGDHQDPKTGACFMELASFLAGEKWSDRPACANPLLTQISQRINDNVSDEIRQQLLPLVPRVIGTAKWNEDVRVLDLLVAYVHMSLRSAPETSLFRNLTGTRLVSGAQNLLYGQQMLTTAHIGFHPGTEITEITMVARWQYLGNALNMCVPYAEDPVLFLTNLYDAFDHATGRDEIEPVKVEQYRTFHEFVNA